MRIAYQLPGAAGPLVPQKAHEEPPEFDVTAMVDLVFMMNIYFLVTFIYVALGEADLPTANRVSPLDADDAVTITLAAGLDGHMGVSLGEGDAVTPLGDADNQEQRVHSFVEAGAADGKHAVLLRAERRVHLGDLFRIASASAVKGLKLHVAVHEKDQP